jgi:hypothetical protein
MNENNLIAVMAKCVQYLNLLNKYDEEYEEYVRCKIQFFVNSNAYFEARNNLLLYYNEARLNNDGDFDKDFGIVLMGYENILRDISSLNRGVEIGRSFSSNCKNLNENDVIKKYQKAIEYHSFIIKWGNETAKIIDADIDELLKQGNPMEALDTLNKFYKPSFYGKYSCFIEHDMIKAKILRRLKN